MFYPGLNLSKLKDEDLQRNLSTLVARLRSTSRSEVANQLRNLISSYQFELNERLFRKSVENDPTWKPGVVYDGDEPKEETQDDFKKLINIG